MRKSRQFKIYSIILCIAGIILFFIPPIFDFQFRDSVVRDTGILSFIGGICFGTSFYTIKLHDIAKEKEKNEKR